MRFAIAIFLGAALALTGAAAAQEKTLRPFAAGVGGQGQIGYLTLTLADQLGYFRDAGLAVEISNFQGGTKSVEALVGGSIDAMAGAYDNAPILQAKGVYLTTIVTFVHHYGYVFGMPPARAAQYHSPKDLKGLKIGVSAPGSSTESLVRILIARDGLTFDDIATIGVGLGRSSVAALISGRIDAVVTGDPEATSMTLNHQFVPIVDTRTREGMDYVYGGEAAGAGSLVMESYIKAHPEIVQSYVDALYRAQQWLLHATPDEIAAKVPEGFLGGDPDLYKTTLVRNRDSFTPDGRTTLAKATITYQSMVHAGRLPESQKIDFARSFDDSFVERAAKSQGQ